MVNWKKLIWPSILATFVSGAALVQNFVKKSGEDNSCVQRVIKQNPVQFNQTFTFEDPTREVRQQCAVLYALTPDSQQSTLEEYIEESHGTSLQQKILPKIEENKDLIELLSSKGIPIQTLLEALELNKGIFSNNSSGFTDDYRKQSRETQVKSVAKNWNRAKRALDKFGFDTAGEDGFHRIADLARDTKNLDVVEFYAKAGCKVTLKPEQQNRSDLHNYLKGPLKPHWGGMWVSFYNNQTYWSKTSFADLKKLPVMTRTTKTAGFFGLDCSEVITANYNKAFKHITGKDAKPIQEILESNTERIKQATIDEAILLGTNGTKENQLFEQYRQAGLGHVSEKQIFDVSKFARKLNDYHDFLVPYIDMHNKARNKNQTEQASKPFNWEGLVKLSNYKQHNRSHPSKKAFNTALKLEARLLSTSPRTPDPLRFWKTAELIESTYQGKIAATEIDLNKNPEFAHILSSLDSNVTRGSLEDQNIRAYTLFGNALGLDPKTIPLKRGMHQAIRTAIRNRSIFESTYSPLPHAASAFKQHRSYSLFQKTERQGRGELTWHHTLAALVNSAAPSSKEAQPCHEYLESLLETDRILQHRLGVKLQYQHMHHPFSMQSNRDLNTLLNYVPVQRFQKLSAEDQVRFVDSVLRGACQKSKVITLLSGLNFSLLPDKMPKGNTTLPTMPSEIDKDPAFILKSLSDRGYSLTPTDFTYFWGEFKEGYANVIQYARAIQVAEQYCNKEGVLPPTSIKPILDFAYNPEPIKQRYIKHMQSIFGKTKFTPSEFANIIPPTHETSLADAVETLDLIKYTFGYKIKPEQIAPANSEPDDNEEDESTFTLDSLFVRHLDLRKLKTLEHMYNANIVFDKNSVAKMTTYRAQEKSVKAQIEYKADQILRNPKLRYAQRTTVKFNDFLYGK